MSSLSRETRSSRGKGKPQLASFNAGITSSRVLPTSSAGYWSPSYLFHTSASEVMSSFGGIFLPVFYSAPSAFHCHKTVIPSSPTPRPAVRGWFSPLPPHAEYVKLRVIAEQRHIFMKCLCSQHPVEGVFVVSGQESGSLGMLRGDRKKQISCRRYLGDKVFRQIPSEIELSQAVFGRHLPRRRSGDDDLIAGGLNDTSGAR